MTTSPLGDTEILAEGRRVLGVEAAAVNALAARLDKTFVDAVRIVSQCQGRVVVSGIGKSGLIARKVAATLTSTGTPAFFLHPVEGMHGDLGVVGQKDVALLFSKSGDTEELAGLIEYVVRHGLPIVAVTGNSESQLGRHANVVLDCAVDEEACALRLAPTSSTTAALAMGDALAVALLRVRGFQPEDFARLHPGGALGRKLSVRVKDVMIHEGYPFVSVEMRMRDVIVPLAELRGTVPVVDADHQVVGVVTAGDLTRLMERSDDFLAVPVADVMTASPKVAHREDLGAAAVRVMEQHGIMALPVTEEQRLIGIVHLHDLMRAGAV